LEYLLVQRGYSPPRPWCVRAICRAV